MNSDDTGDQLDDEEARDQNDGRNHRPQSPLTGRRADVRA